MNTNTVTKAQIDEIMSLAHIEVQTVLGKCTVVTCQLPNGFIIVESSACVDPANYDEKLGKEICLKRIENKVWELEGYKLQSRFAEEEGYSTEDLAEIEAEFGFDVALAILKEGEKVARKGWNGTGMFAYYVEPASYPAKMDAIKGVFENDMVPYRGYFALKTAQNDVATWVPSGSDILAEDWMVVK